MKPAATLAGGPPGPERRLHARLRVAAVSTVSLRLRGGEVLKLLNVSAAGALVESTRRLLPGHRYALQWSSGRTVQALRGEVVRARVWRLHGDADLTYEVALLFDQQVVQPMATDGAVNSLPMTARTGGDTGAPSSQSNVSA